MSKAQTIPVRVARRRKHNAARRPSAATRKALREARCRTNVESFESVEAWAKVVCSPLGFIH